MKIASWNVNGIRAVERKKELQKFFDTTDPDIFFLQEIKAKTEQLSKFLTENSDYRQFYHSAEKPGYAGTGVWIKKSLFEKELIESSLEFKTGMPDWDDNEGRISQLHVTNKSEENLIFLGVYFPNGGKSPEAWDEKLVFYDHFLSYVNQLRDKGKTVIWMGDVNCAHNEIDLARPETNQKSIGFLPEERAWVGKCIEQGWSDIWRSKFPTEVIYSWWHVITRARERNVGWRIDYVFCDEAFLPRVKKIEYLNHQMGSDHCPVIIEI